MPAQGGGNLMHLGRHTEINENHNISSPIRRERKRKKSHSLVNVLVAWFVIMLSLAALIKWKWNASPSVTQAPDAAITPSEQSFQSENQELFQEAYPDLAHLTLQLCENFAPESLSQLCRPRPRLNSIIFNDGAKAAINKPEAIQLAKHQVIHPNGTPLIETLWKDDRGRLIEMIFAKEDDQWLLDWESYAKSSSAPWNIFQSGTDDAIGTFRFLVRERLVDTNRIDTQMSIVFYEPSFLHGGPLGPATPDFLIDRKSRNGRLISAALQARREGKPLMGSMLSQADPPNTARVTVKIRRSFQNSEKIFNVEEVTACHWMGIDHLGVDLTDAP